MTETDYHNWIRKESECVKCKAPEAEVCHYSGRYASTLGKGLGLKAHWHCCAALCRRCHTEFDSYQTGNTDERAIDFMLRIFETQRRYHDARGQRP
jgi:5-methylcytosine-specific restriction endonuclease McrA